ncbi:MAG TPA: Ig-like domain-containing protein [Myxococcales bacterium]|nr:Ig-like domain-containing protein [Myxococcales bacterium]
MLRSVVLCLVLGACQAPTLELEVPLAVVNWSPQDGATGVCPSWPVTVCFNQPIDPSSLPDFLVGTAQSCQSGSPIAASAGVAALRADTLKAGASPNCVVMAAPSAGWSAGACYTVEVEGEDLQPGGGAAGELPGDGGTDLLAVTLRSIFRVASDSSGCLDGG